MKSDNQPLFIKILNLWKDGYSIKRISDITYTKKNIVAKTITYLSKNNKCLPLPLIGRENCSRANLVKIS